MNCQDAVEKRVEYHEGLLDPSMKSEVDAHLDSCSPCREAYAELARIQDLIKGEAAAFTHAPLEGSVMDRIFRKQTVALRKFRRQRWGVAAAAAVLISLFAGVFLRTDKATASEVLAMASRAVARLESVYIEALMRSPPHDNFEYIELEHDLVPLKMWKVFGPDGTERWRVEKPRRVVVMDGESTRLFLEPNFASKGGTEARFVEWLKPLMDVHEVLQGELRLAKEQGSDLALHRTAGPGGEPKLHVVVEARAQGDYTHDWCRNKSITASDNRRVYRFDAETKLLEALEVHVHTGSGDVLVLKITDIRYNPVIPSEQFTLTLPDDVIWFVEPEPLADNVMYESMTPEEAARAFFQACADKDWGEALKFMALSKVPERMKTDMGGLELISLGEAFKSGQGYGWYVPYAFRVKEGGEVQEHCVHLRHAKKARRFIITGGL
jgi:hypothetical protein